MSAEERILKLLKDRKEEGILQSEIVSELGLSKSTVSEILRRLEEEGVVVRERVAGKSMRVWLSEYSPKPVRGLIRVGVLRASEYPHVLLACEDLGARVKVFESAIDLTRALAFGSIDVGVSPFVTQTLFALTLRSIRIHRIVAYNGSGVVMKEDIKRCKRFATSELSAMESNLKLFLERLGILDVEFKYFSSPETMIDRFRKCEFDAMAIWEPYFTMMDYYKIEFREVIGDFPCCSLASNVQFQDRGLLESFLNKLEGYAKDFDRRKGARIVARVMGFDEDIVLKSFDSYCFSADPCDFEFLENYGLKLTDEIVRKIADVSPLP